MATATKEQAERATLDTAPAPKAERLKIRMVKSAAGDRVALEPGDVVLMPTGWLAKRMVDGGLAVYCDQTLEHTKVYPGGPAVERR